MDTIVNAVTTEERSAAHSFNLADWRKTGRDLVLYLFVAYGADLAQSIAGWGLPEWVSVTIAGAIMALWRWVKTSQTTEVK